MKIVWKSMIVFVVACLMLMPARTLAAPSSDDPPPPEAVSALGRTHDPVVLTGLFTGRPANQIFVYRWNAGAWEQIPFQIDERNAAGDYVANEDGVMDANDEIVFMAGDTGQSTSNPISNALPVSGIWYRVEVRDPLNPANKGWVYVVHSASLSITNPTDYASFNSAAGRINTPSYGMGWAASGHNGLDYLSMFGGGDILDRTKLRIDYRFIVLIELNEEDFPVDSLSLIKDGNVRVLVKRGGTVTQGYRDFASTAYTINLSTLPGSLERVRTSTDLAAGVTGTYYDENNAAGVAIDGTPDSVSATPFQQAWREVVVGAGANIQVAKLTELGGTPRHYYKDNSAVDPNDTGDQKSFGDSGFEVVSPSSRNFTIVTGQYFLPAAQGNQGATYYQYFQNPLQAVATVEAAHKTFMPSLQKQ